METIHLDLAISTTALALRKFLGLNLNELATASGIDPERIDLFERGQEQAALSHDEVERIAFALNVPFELIDSQNPSRSLKRPDLR